MTVDEILNLIENPQTAIHIQWRKSEYRSYSKEKEENIKSHKWISILRLKLKDEYEYKSNWYHRVPVSPHKSSPDCDIVIDKNAIVTRNSKDFFTTAEDIYIYIHILSRVKDKLLSYQQIRIVNTNLSWTMGSY